MVVKLPEEIKLANTASTKVFKDPQGRTLTVNSPDGSMPSEQELDQMFQAKYGADKPVEQKQPGLLEKVGHELSRPGAAVREGIRSGLAGGMDNENLWEDVGSGIKRGFQKPESSEPFDAEAGRKANEAMDKSWVSKLPEGPQTAVRYAGSIVPRELGFIANTASDPTQLALMALTDGAMKGLGKIPYKGITLGERASELPISKMLASEEGQASKATDLALKARDKAVKLFPNQDGSLEQIRNSGEQTSKYLSKSNNYEDVANQIEMAKGINAGERQKLYDSGSLSESRPQHDPILKLIKEYEKSPLANTKEGQSHINQLKEIHASDVEFLNSQSPETLNDPNFYQKQKEVYQGKAHKAGSYKENPTESLKSDAYRAMSEGYQGKTHAVNEAVAPLDTEQKGLIQSHNQAREMAKQEALGMKPSLAKEVVGSISGSPVQTGARFVRKTLIDKAFGSPAKGLSQDISGLMAKSEKAQNLSDIIAQMKNKPSFMEGELEYPKELPAPTPRQLESPTDMANRNRPNDIKSGKLLQGSRQGETIKAEGRGPAIELNHSGANVPAIRQPGLQPRKPSVIELSHDGANFPAIPDEGLRPRQPQSIELPEHLDSDMERLATKWGVPERNIREIINASDIEPVVKSSTTEGLIQSKSRRKFIDQIMARRNRNFGSR